MSDSQFDCETATASEMAGAVVEYIEEHGWTTGYMGSGKGPVCLLGAVSAVCTGDPAEGFEVWDGEFEAVGSAAVEALKIALKADGQIPTLADGTLSSLAIYRFNDHVAENREQALAPFRRVAGLPEVVNV